MTNIEFLKTVIERLHGGTAIHAESVPVVEIFEGKTVWDGIVEVFHLEGHSKTDKAYAWVHEPRDGKRYPVTVLHIHPALTPLAAVQAFIVQEFRNANPTEA